MKNALEINRLTKSFPGENQRLNVVVQDFDLTVEEGEFVAILGHSGCGKSTVLNMVAGLIEPTSGTMVLAGKEITGAGPDRGVVFQSPCLFPWLSAYDNVRMGVDQVFYTASAVERHQIVEYYLSLVGLTEAIHRRPSELSQGMRQRVGIARAFALAPKMLLLDEPFGMLDSLTRVELQDVLLDLWFRDQKTAIMVTHDIDEAIILADRIVLMTDGPCAEVGEVLEVSFERPRDRTKLPFTSGYIELKTRILEYLESKAQRRMPLIRTTQAA